MKDFLIVFGVALLLFFGIRFGYMAVIASSTAQTQTKTETNTVTNTTNNDTTGMSDEQADALSTAGINPSLITSITPEQEACFTVALGSTRVLEIKTGAVPNATDLFKVRHCL